MKCNRKVPRIKQNNKKYGMTLNGLTLPSGKIYWHSKRERKSALTYHIDPVLIKYRLQSSLKLIQALVSSYSLKDCFIR